LIKLPVHFDQCLDCGALVGDPKTHSRSHSVPCKFTIFKLIIHIPEKRKNVRVPKKREDSL